MSLDLVLRRAAAKEFEAALDWYESRSPGLGVQFAARVQAALERVRQDPEMHAPALGAIRRVRVRAFPYSIYYRIRGPRIVVLAVFHDRRDPRIWQERR